MHKSKLPARRLVAFLMLGACTAVLHPAAAQAQTRLRNPTVPQDTVQGRDVVTPAYEGALQEADRQRIESAREQGGSAIPTIRGRPTESLSIPPEIEAARDLQIVEPEPIIPHRPLIVTPAQPAMAPASAGVQADEQRLADYMRQLSEIMAIQPVPATVEYHHEPRLEPELEAAVPVPVQVAVSAGPDFLLPPAGTIVYGAMTSRADSDAPGPVVAQILQGPLQGASLIGSFTMGRDNLMITFTRMTVRERVGGVERSRTVEINAVAVDTRHVGTGVATKVDRHIIQNTAFTFGAAFLQGMGEAVGRSGSVVTYRPDGGHSVANPVLGTREQLYVAGGTAAGSVSGSLTQNFGNRPTTVIVESGAPIGILFL